AGRKPSRRHPALRDHAWRQAVRVAARRGLHSSCLAGSRRTQPVVGSRPVGRLRHRRVPIRLGRKKTAAPRPRGEAEKCNRNPWEEIMRRHLLASTTAFTLLFGAVPAFADMDAARAFLDAEIGDMSSLDRAAQEAEMEWFIKAAEAFKGMDIKVVSE